MENISTMARQVGVMSAQDIGDALAAGRVDVLDPDELTRILGSGIESIPVLVVKWADERQWCSAVHDYLAGEGLASSEGCKCHKTLPDGRRYCSLVWGPKSAEVTGEPPVPCLFDEPENSLCWQKARRWVLVTLKYEDGTTEECLTRAEYAETGAPWAVGERDGSERGDLP